MKEFELMVNKKLISLYMRLYTEGVTDEIRVIAKKTYDEAIPGNQMLGELTNNAVGKLFSIAYPNVDKDRKVPSKEEIKYIIHNLEKISPKDMNG